MDPRSEASLVGVHPDLVKVVRRADQLTTQPFIVIQGLRTLAQERANVAKGASQTMKSRHLDGHAIDVAAMKDHVVDWAPLLYSAINDAFQLASAELNVPITWGGSWKTLKDFGHFELTWAAYPSVPTTAK